MKKFRLIASAAALSMAALEAQAGIPILSPGELALLPSFCQDVQTVNGWEQHVRESPRAPMWVAQMGRSFWDMHHYCWARTAAHRSKAVGLGQNHRDHLIETAIEDMGYVVRRAPPDMVMLPEIYYWLGEYYGSLKRYGEAYEAYQKSREAKPDYWPAYAGHADLLAAVGQRNTARTVLEHGLKLMPAETALRSRLERLGAGAKGSSEGQPAKRSKPTPGVADNSGAASPSAVSAPK